MPVKAKKHTQHHLPTLAFIRAGNQIINLAHVSSVELPADGKPLTIHYAQGGNLTLSEEGAAEALEALGECCDCEPAEPAKAAKPAAPPK